MRSHPTAGQATLDYIAAIALVVAVFLVAAPAVGAPDVGARVADALRHGICLAGGDICTDADARRAGLAPCPLRSQTTGAEAALTAFSIEVGGKWLLTVTPQSDGTVAAVRTAAASAGVVGGPTAGATLGPVLFEAGMDGALRARVQAARGWTFPDVAHARAFLKHATRHSFDERRFPPAWESAEYGAEAAASAHAAAGVDGVAGGDLAGVSVSGQDAIGMRVGRDGTRTNYTRISLSGPDVTVPFAAPAGRGRTDWVAEYTSDARGPRELVFRTAAPIDGGRSVLETAARLDLRDPANLAVARPLLASPEPWSALGGPGKQAVMDRIATDGTVETLHSSVADETRGASVSVKALLKFSAGARRVRIRKTLRSATATRGLVSGRRLDCVRRPG